MLVIIELAVFALWIAFCAGYWAGTRRGRAAMLEEGFQMGDTHFALHDWPGKEEFNALFDELLGRAPKETAL